MAEASQALTQGQAMAEGPSNPLGQYIGDKALRQLGLIAGLAAAIAAGIGLFVWAQGTDFRPLFTQLEQEDAQAVMDALQASAIEYKVDPNSGAILIPAGQIHEARLKLAAQGLPKASGMGFDMLQQDQGFGTSQFIQNARFYRALETELARSISHVQSVKSARVHLAVPKESVFVRERSEPRASVVVNLHGGRNLSEGQVSAIVHLVASSVANLAEKNVTVVNQDGDLLTDKDGGGLADASTKQLEYKQQLESNYVRRITALLEPIVGPNRVRAQVNARLDFSVEESTQELYDPDSQVLRSEQTLEERMSDAGVGGVPGALANQPPQAGTLEAEEQDAGGGQASSSRSATRNFEISKTVRHVRQPQGVIERLSVAVLVDQQMTTNDEGEVVREPLPQAQLNQISTLVRDAVGFDAQRGDSINVISAAFKEIAEEEVEPVEPPIWEQPWFWSIGKLVLASILGLVLILAVVRPLVYALLGRDGKPRGGDKGQAGSQQLGGPTPEQLIQEERERLALTDESKKQEYEDAMAAAREVVTQEPALAANVVKNWLSEDD